MADVATSGQVHEFLRVLRRRRWQIVMPAIFVLALGTVFAVLVPKKYIISTRVELLEGQRAESDPALKNRGGSAVQREVDNVAYHLSNYNRIEEVVKEEAGLWPEYVTADTKGRREVIERIQGGLEVSQIEKRRNEGSTFVDIEYRDVSGDRAVRFLEDLIDKWVREVVERDKNNLTAERENFQDDVDDALLELREARKQFTDLAREMGIDPVLPSVGGTSDRQSDPIHQRLVYLEQKLQDVQSDLASAEEVHKVSGQLFEEADEMVPANIEGDLFQAQLRANEAISQLELARANMLETNSKWQKAQREIDEIKALLANEEAKLLQERPLVPNEDLPALLAAERVARIELQRLRAEEELLLRQKDDKEAERDRRIDQMNELLDLKGRVEEKDLAFKTVFSYYNDKNIALSQLSAYSDPYDIIRAPEVEGAPLTPSAMLLVLMSAFAGLALGLSLALAAEYARNSYRTVADIAQVMAIPVLGTVDQIVTSVEARRVQARRAVVGLSSAVILGGLAWFTWIWAVSPNKLPVEVRVAIEEFRKLLM